MWFDINIHLPHHLAPKIPWYHLRRAAEAIKASHAEWYQERQFSLSYLLASWRRPLIQRTPGHDYYEMARFE
jgi:omega-6 fatty acid desaturase (delta-12 desaturase)